MNRHDFTRRRRHIAIAWVALLVLMLSSLGSAYVSLGPGNIIAGLGIAAVKSAIVIVLFMGLGRSSTMVRIAAAAGLATWLLLVALSGVDYATRAQEPAVFQQPQQLQPLARHQESP